MKIAMACDHGGLRLKNVLKDEEKTKAKYIRVGLLAGKSAEIISEELNVSVDYVLELDKRIRGK